MERHRLNVRWTGTDRSAGQALQRLAGVIFFFLLGALAASVSLAEAAPGDLLQLPAVKTTRAARGLLLDVALAGTRMVAVGEQGRIVYSDDSGVTWIQAEVPVRVTLTAVYFPSAQNGWAVGHDGVILNSTDGGRTWKKQLDGAQINKTAYAQIEARTAAAASSNVETGAAASDREELNIYLKNLELIVSEGSTWPFLDVWFADDRNGFAIGAFGMAAQTVDGGSTWEPILDRLANPKGLHYYGIAPAGRDLFIAGEAGILLRSEDQGRTWIRLQSPYEGSYFGIIGTAEGDAVIAFGLRGRAFRSTDHGGTWKPLAAPAGAAWMGAALLPDDSLLLVSPGIGGVLSNDKGLTFSSIPSFPLGAAAAAATRDGKIVAVGSLGAQTVTKK